MTITEPEALSAAKLSVVNAMNALELYRGGSYAADEAYNDLDNVVIALDKRLAELRDDLGKTPTDIGGPACPGVWDGTMWDDTG